MPRELRRTQLLFWAALAVLYGTFDIGRQPDPAPVSLIYRAVVWSVVGFLVTCSWIPIYRYLDSWLQRRSLRLAVAIVLSVVGGLFWFHLFHLVDGLFSIEAGWTPFTQLPREEIIAEWMNYSLVSLVWMGGLETSLLGQQAAFAREQALRSEAALVAAQLDNLEAQLRPHFLFNTLNSAMALIPLEPKEAEKVLQSLSELLRRTLSRDTALVTLSDELSTVEAYLSIEKVRYEDRLNYLTYLDEGLEMVLLPAFTLLTLVENAIKHGMEQLEDAELVIRIKISSQGGLLLISVSNPGTLQAGYQHPLSLGVGLSNLRKRLHAQYGAHAVCELRDSSGVEALLSIPLEKRQ